MRIFAIPVGKGRKKGANRPDLMRPIAAMPRGCCSIRAGNLALQIPRQLLFAFVTILTYVRSHGATSANAPTTIGVSIAVAGDPQSEDRQALHSELRKCLSAIKSDFQSLSDNPESQALIAELNET